MAKDQNDDQTQSFVILSEGTVVGQYKIVKKIGAGGMGEVYLAHDTRLDRKVALKFLPPHLCQDEDCRTRFRREAQAAAKLDHLNIITVYEVGNFSERPFMAMQYIDGNTLSELVEQKKFDVKSVIEIAIQLSEGLKQAHGMGIVHRDIKPSNILIDSNGRPKLVDFGLAKIKDAQELTQAGSTMGTAGYMSPEQIEGATIDTRSDLFSLGVLIYELISGHNPFKQDNQAATLRAILEIAPEPLKNYKIDFPNALQDIVTKLLQKNPENRYQKAEMVIDDLKRLQKRKVKPKEEPYIGPSIAVLPFTNLSTDPEQEYFCDGMAEEIINALTKVENLRVVARTSCFAFKGKNEDIRTIGEKLNVTTILEGSVRKAGNQLRITAQLINVSDGYHLWSEKYDRAMQDVFAIQDEISLTIVDKLRIKLPRKEKISLTRHYTENIEAYNLYLKGRFCWNNRTTPELMKAKGLFEQVLTLDPDYALAYTGLADCYGMLGQSYDLPSEEAFSKAREMAQKALVIDNTLAEAHTSLAYVLTSYDWNWDEAEIEFRHAIELNPNYPTAHQWYGLLLMNLGRIDEALEETKKAHELDPLSPILGVARSLVALRAGMLEEAKRICHQQIEDHSHFPFGAFILGRIWEVKGEHDKAVELYLKLLEIDGNYGENEVESLNKAFHESGWKGYNKKIIDIEEHKKPPLANMDIAGKYVILGEFDRAFEWLEKAYQARDPNLFTFNVDTQFNPIRSDPRFKEMLRKIGLKTS